MAHARWLRSPSPTVSVTTEAPETTENGAASEHTGPRLILCADTSTEHATVALVRQGPAGDTVLGVHTSFQPKGHGPGVLDDLHGLLEAAGCTLANVTHLITGLGPGSFTGLRIALATLKGVALATGQPLYGVRTTALLRAVGAASAEARAAQAPQVFGVIDARRDEVYLEGPGFERPVVCTPGTAAKAMLAAAYGENSVILVGSGALAYAEVWRTALPGVRIPAAAEAHVPDATRMPNLVDWAAAPPPLATLEPVYVRRSDAEIKFPHGIPDALGRRQG